MTISGPKVRDYTDSRREIELDIVYGDAFETVLAVFVFAAGRREEAEYEVGEDWFSSIEARVGADLLAPVGDTGCCAWAWLALLGVALDLPEPRSAENLVAYLRATDPILVRRQLLEATLGQVVRDPEVLDRVAAGDREAFTDAVSQSRDDLTGLEWLIDREAADVRDVLADVVATFAEVAHPDRGRVAGVLARDAEHKQTLARTMPPERLVEVATNGVTFAMQPEVRRIVLVPSVVLRPWVTISEHGSTRIFCYPVADEHLTADPDAPPSWLVGFFKALADERRLRLLSVLAEGPAGLAELTTRVDLAKSTVHHHLRVLRTAGLVRVTVGDEKEYSLRTDAVPEAARMLEAYLGAIPQGA